MKENLTIVTNRILRDERTERRIIEMNRERYLYIMMLIGGILVIYAILY